MLLSSLRSFVEKLAARGTAVVCPCCNHTARRFFPAGVTNKRPFARCAFCGSLERHRLIALMLKERQHAKGITVLCIAPEEPLTLFLKNEYSAKLTTSDLLRKDVDVQADVCALPFENAGFDLVVANHVLEHVADDKAAMRELCRALKPGGQAIVQTPVRWDKQVTEENPNADKEERLRRFGQDDHIRMYGQDIVERLRTSEWQVAVVPVNQKFSPADIRTYGLEAGEVFFQIIR